MAGLKRRLLETSRGLTDIQSQYGRLLIAHEAIQREHDHLLALLIALARESQDRAWNPRPLRVRASTLATDAGWAITTSTPTNDFVEIRAIAQVPAVQGAKPS